jgi:hypothetical protein
LRSFLAELKDPLLRALERGDDGYEFADFFCQWKGDTLYEAMVEQGPDALMQALSTYPPIWEVVTKIPVRFSKFLEEFMDDSEEQEPAPAPAPVARARAAKAGAPSTTVQNLEPRATRTRQEPSVPPSPTSGPSTLPDPLQGVV